MDDVRLVRREDQSLIVATEGGEEYRLVVDETVLAELRHLSRPARGAVRINPREVQAMVRAGRTRAEIAEATGVEEALIERYEEPVLAERRYVLERAQAVPVRTSPAEDGEQQFGTVIAERLIGLGAAQPEWSSWRDEDAGWMVCLTFTSRDADHRAVWSFDHRKGLLSPLSPDAESLSKQGGVGDRLIPKLRAVGSEERFDSGAFDPDGLRAEPESPVEEDGVYHSGPVAADHPSTGSIPIVDPEAEYARRRTIEEHAIKSPAPELPDLGQTADLLDALRRRRGERDAAAHSADASDGPDADAPAPNAPVPFPGAAREDAPADRVVPADAPAGPTAADTDDATAEVPIPPQGSATPTEEKPARRGKGRAAIPSWDDILFGTRSDEDPV